jgi:hypothetical protein
MIIWQDGNLYPFTWKADMIRSWLSFTALSGSPTRKNLIPRAVLASIVTMYASIPWTAAPETLISIIEFVLDWCYLCESEI